MTARAPSDRGPPRAWSDSASSVHTFASTDGDEHSQLSMLSGFESGYESARGDGDGAEGLASEAGERQGRFLVGPEIGVGGMGRVSLVRDQRLLRDVAWKRGDWWLLREARILAQLEHPGIVPIHDMGFDPEGRPYFAMRVVKGRSLSELLRTTPAEERLTLLRPLLQAAEAVAYAHHRGVVHRDLKPANIMIGRFGESQVVDWGLARVLADGEEPIPGEVACSLKGQELGRVGTPGYMSPEQEAGLPADRRSDVYGLGRILARIVGMAGMAGTAGTAGMSGVGAEPGADPNAGAAPLELRAIVTKSTARDPAERYPDAASFAADLERYLDGRRVSAHTYGQRELFRRFVRQHRLPLVIASVGAVALLVMGALYVIGVDAERVVAEQAAAATKDALAQSDAHLARSLVGEARRLVGQGARAEAEVLAAHALTLTEDPDARGVLASLFGAPALELVSRQAFTCAESQVEASRGVALCSHPEGVELWDVTSTPARLRWAREHPVRLARVTAGGVVVGSSATADVTMFDWAGEEIFRGRSPHSITRKSASDGALAVFVSATTSVVADLRARSIHPVLVCGDALHAALAVRDDAVHDPEVTPLAAALCKDGTLLTGERRVPTALVAPEREGVLMTMVGRERVVVGTTKGEVVVLATDGRVLASRPAVHGMVRLLAASPDGHHLAVAGEGDPIELLTLPDLARVASLPRRAKSLAWDGERHGELMTTGAWVERWRLTRKDDLRPLRGAYLVPMADGVVSLDIDPDRPERVVVGFGPYVGVLESAGARTQRLDLITVKGASFAGEALMAGGSAALFALEADTLEVVGRTALTRWAVRRFVTLADGTRLIAPYGELRRWFDDGFERVADGPALDLSVSPNRRFAVFLRESDRGFVRLRSGEPGIEEVGGDVLAEAVAISADGARVYSARLGAVAAWDDAGHLERVYDAGDARLIDVEVSLDGRWVAAGARDGTVLLWSSDRAEVRARFSDHSERVPALAFSVDSSFLLSGSWDRTLRVRDLAVIDAPIGPVVARLRERYAMGIEEALGGR